MGRQASSASCAPRQAARIQKVLSEAGLASRREAERWLAEGRIAVNGTVVRRPGTKVDLSRDRVEVDGRSLGAPSPRVYYLLNKPAGCVTTTRDPQGRFTVMDLLRGVRERVFPVGRLDYHTSGLLILTNDGDLADRLLRPSTGCPKTYHARVKGRPGAATLRRLARGIAIEGRRTRPCRLRVIGGEGNAWIEIVLKEGRRNQIRRMFQKVGHPVGRLRRVAVGPLALRGLPEGACRRLTAREVRRLREALA